MKKTFFGGLVLILILFLAACSNNTSKNETATQKNVEITVSAAASLGDALGDIKSRFEKKYPDLKLLINLGGSGALQQQIIQGAPTDIFISAAKDQFSALSKAGLLENQQQVDLLSNQLVLITNKSNGIPIDKFSDLTKNSIKKMAIGTPESVPAGMYAKQTLQHLGIWGHVQQKTIETKDVRQVLTYVETNNVDAGIVYMTDAKVSDKVRVAAIANNQDHDPIIYPAGIIKASHHKHEATLFYDYLRSSFAKGIFEKYGFKVLD